MENSAETIFFENLHLHPDAMEGIASMGFSKPTPVQEQAIPVILSGADLIACAQTGTGKTAAFLIPIIHHILTQTRSGTQALVIVPTRELTVQIDQQLQGLGYYSGISSKAVYGGGDGAGWELEKTALTQGCDVIIGTPGKLLQHMVMGYVQLDSLKFLILDEADRMLDMGFYEDIMRILDYLPKKRQNLMFSATMPPQIRQMAKAIMHKPVEISLALAKPAEGIMQSACLVQESDKARLIHHLLEGKKMESILVFASTKSSVKQLAKTLADIPGFSVRAMHSDLDQPTREATLNSYRNREFQILVATDILSRGIDIDRIELVINYNVPQDAEDYVHRVGRTARAENTGLAITLISPRELESFKRIEKLVGYQIYRMKLPDGFKEGHAPATPERPHRSYNRKKKG
ncbi:MAG TPA: DEAD/DEAH box helicase [Bacteroidales bacterium]|nr:DEAD/DEAH box helicase [Bacteroidales bacterium]